MNRLLAALVLEANIVVNLPFLFVSALVDRKGLAALRSSIPEYLSLLDFDDTFKGSPSRPEF